MLCRKSDFIPTCSAEHHYRNRQLQTTEIASESSVVQIYTTFLQWKHSLAVGITNMPHAYLVGDVGEETGNAFSSSRDRQLKDEKINL